jgi:hypothetical protein
VTDWSEGPPNGPNPVAGSGPQGPDAHNPPSSGRWEPGGAAQPPYPSPPQSPSDRWQPAGPEQQWQPQSTPPGPPWPGPPQPPAAPQHWQGPPPGFSPPPGNPFGQPPPPRKNRKPLIITLAAGGAVIVVVAIVLAITLAGGDGGSKKGGSAGEVVTAYLEALSRGDAEEALTYGVDQPASKELLTDDILKKQTAEWPITNIRILSDDSKGAGAAIGMASVHVAVNFGDKTSDTTLQMKKDGNLWKLGSAAVKIEPTPGSENYAAARTLTYFGKPAGDSTVYVFPGWVDIGTTNPYMTVSAKPMLLDQLSLFSISWMQPSFVLSDKGTDAVKAQLKDALASCQKSNQLAPPGCPVHLDPYGYAEGTAAWGPADMSKVEIKNFDPYRLTLLFSGEVTVPVTVKTDSGETNQGNVTPFIVGTADMTKTPPELDFT